MGDYTLLTTKTKFALYILYSYINNKGFYFIVLFKFDSHVNKTVHSEIIHSKCHEIMQLCLGFDEPRCMMPAKYPGRRGRRRATS